MIDKLPTGVVHASLIEAGERLRLPPPGVDGHIPSGPFWRIWIGASRDHISQICEGDTTGLTRGEDIIS